MRKTLALWVILALLACEENLVERPEDLIPQAKMVDILYDVAVLGAAEEINSDVLREYEIDPTVWVLEQYGVDSLQFTKSDLYYASRPKEYEAIYAEVKERLEEVKARLDELRKQQGDSARQRTIIRNKPATE